MRIWSLESRSQRKWFNGHTGWINSVSFAPDGRHVLSGSDDTTVRLWHVDKGAVKNLGGDSHRVLKVAFSNDGRRALSGTAHGVSIWDLSAEPVASTVAVSETTAPVSETKPPPVPSFDTKQLVGTWSLVTARENGIELVADGNTVTIATGQWNAEGNAFNYRIDATRTPAEIDWEIGAQTWTGIIDLDGNNLRLCFAPPGVARPTAFASTPGDQRHLHVRKRVGRGPLPTADKQPLAGS